MANILRTLQWFVVVMGGTIGSTIIFIVGNETGSTWIDGVYRCMFVYPIGCIKVAVVRVAGQKGLFILERVLHYIFRTNNCLVQVLYLIVMCGGYTLFCYSGYPCFPNPNISEYHKYTAFLAVGVCLLLFVLCSTSDPGVLDHSNVQPLLEIYPYDGMTYLKGRTCSTCKLPKPARSKHCAICGHCVIRFDHHCVWVANDIGALNYRLFLLFLATHSAMCWYGTIALPLLLLGMVNKLRMWEATFVDRITNAEYSASWSLIMQHLMNHYTGIFLLASFCILFAIILSCFFVWHIYLGFICNCTTNETFKLPELAKSHENETSGEDKPTHDVMKGVALNNDDSTWTFDMKFAILRRCYDNGILSNIQEIVRPRDWLERKWGEVSAARSNLFSEVNKKRRKKLS